MPNLSTTLRQARVSFRRLGYRRLPIVVVALCAAASLVLNENRPRGALIDASVVSGSPQYLNERVRGVFSAFDEYSAYLDRKREIASFSLRYDIDVDLASDIYAAAENAGVDPDLAYRLVRLESDFAETATSPVGAIGLTQVMLPTAQFYDPDITPEQLYDRQLNLRIGLAYLREMLDQHEGDVMLALAAYNRGPAAIGRLLAQGMLPNNAYERLILKGYAGKGILE
jgi:soluble lytic murein transglycosylase-like protein